MRLTALCVAVAALAAVAVATNPAASGFKSGIAPVHGYQHFSVSGR